MVVTIASPDKTSIAMFLSFLRKNLGRGHIIGETHSLMSEESLSDYVDSLLKINSKVIFTFYAKRKINIDPIKCIPQKLINLSDTVVWFNLYETSYKLIKDSIEFDKLFLDTWNKNLKQLG